MLILLLQVVVARDAIQPHMAIDGDTVYVTFIRNGQIELAVSPDGLTFATVVAIDAKGKARGGMQRGPRVAVDGRKTVYVTAPLTFDEAEFQKRYPTQDLYLAVSSDGGKTFAAPARINDAPKKAPESLHWLAASSEGAYVAWLDVRQREKGQDLFMAKITAKGVERNQPAALNLCECCAPGMSIDAQGKPTLIYREGGTTNRQIFVSTSGKLTRVNQGDSRVDKCPMDAPAVAVEGKITAAAWMDMRSGPNNRDVHWTIGTGGRFPAEVTIHDDIAGVQGHPSLAIAKDGVVWCAWEDGRGGPNDQRIYVADSKTRKNVPLSAAAEGKCAYPTLARGEGWIGAVYESQGGVSFRRIN